ncbi:MAG: hypothetical protein IBX71_06705 [Candidatus Desulforudis sp.]|nr:hypothetical protein [Desulforudis sp.]
MIIQVNVFVCLKRTPEDAMDIAAGQYHRLGSKKESQVVARVGKPAPDFKATGFPDGDSKLGKTTLKPGPGAPKGLGKPVPGDGCNPRQSGVTATSVVQNRQQKSHDE